MFRTSEAFAMPAAESASPSPAVPENPPFADVSCSQCGRSFGPGWHGFSSCRNHRGITRAAQRRFAVGRVEIDGSFRLIEPKYGQPLVYHTQSLAAAVARGKGRDVIVRDLVREGDKTFWADVVRDMNLKPGVSVPAGFGQESPYRSGGR